MDAAEGQVPEYGFKVRMDHVFPEKPPKPFRKPPDMKQFFTLLVPGLRYFKWWVKCRKRGRSPYMDHFALQPARQMYGAPLGGIGAATIGRGFRGEFCRFGLVPGLYCYKTIKADQFIVNIRRVDGNDGVGETLYQKVLNAGKSGQSGLAAWTLFPASQAHYTALYPRAWYEYEIPEFNLLLTCCQISPVIPHNYKDSSLPAGAFIWTGRILNSSQPAPEQNLHISITFTFSSEIGNRQHEKNSQPVSNVFRKSDGDFTIMGASIEQTLRLMKTTVGLAARSTESVSVYSTTNFQPDSNGADLWNELLDNGHVQTDEKTVSNSSKPHVGVAVSASTTLNALLNEADSLEFSLCWDQPKILFESKERVYLRRYTRWFGASGQATTDLCLYALREHRRWQREIVAWQKPILTDPRLPEWYKSALFNELYFVADGGSVWVEARPEKNGIFSPKPTSLDGSSGSSAANSPTVAAVAAAPAEDTDGPLIEPDKDEATAQDQALHVADDPSPEIIDIGRFAYLEGHEYKM